MNFTERVHSLLQTFRAVFVIIFILFFINARAQNKKTVPGGNGSELDSLLNALNTADEDTLKARILSKLTNQYYAVSDYAKALEYATQQKVLAEKINNKMIMARAYNQVGRVYGVQGNLSSALENYLKSLKIAEEGDLKKVAATSYINIGGVYQAYNDHQKALECDQKALNLYTETKDKRGMAASYNNIGIIYRTLEDHDKAFENYEKCLKIAQELSAGAPDETDYKSLIAVSLNNMGIVYYNKKQYDKALEKQLQALEIKKQINNKLGIASSYENIGNIYAKQHRFVEAENYLNSSVEVYSRLGGRSGLTEVYTSMADMYVQKGDAKNALRYRKLYSTLKDSIVNEQSLKQIAEMNVRYESDRKDKELIKKDVEITRQLAEAKKQQLQRNAFIIGFVLLLVLMFLIFRSYRQKLAINIQLEEKNALIEKQKISMEQKNLKITDSISYAYRIQQATLPSDKKIKELFPQSFVLFRPKEIVSGDFYWMKEIGNNTLIAAADCNGHGVPGAIMSLVFSNSLNKAVGELGIKDPAEILNKVKELITEAFVAENKELIHDGMDISIANIEKRAIEGIKVTWAGANNPLWLFKKNKSTEQFEFVEVNGDKQKISKGQDSFSFTTHELELNAGDMFFLFSDGFAKSFNNGRGIEYGYRKLKDLIASNTELPVANFKIAIENSIESEMANLEQLDDILIIGIKL